MTVTVLFSVSKLKVNSMVIVIIIVSVSKLMRKGQFASSASKCSSQIKKVIHNWYYKTLYLSTVVDKLPFLNGRK